MKSNKLFSRHIFILCAATLLVSATASACTDVILSDKFLGKKWIQSGRNLDCDVNLSPAIASYPAKMIWTTKDSSGNVIALGRNFFSFIGVNVLSQNKKLVDGMNREGFSAALLWMDDAKFPATAEGNSAMAMSDLVAWLLGSCSSVADARTALSKKVVWYDSTVLPHPAHLVLHDAKGESLVVEWINGAPVYVDKKNGYNGVLANGPNYKSQIENLAHFKNLSNQPDQMVGLPGDQTSLSRFTRLSILSKYAIQIICFPDTIKCFWYFNSPYIYGSEWCLQQILHLMNRVTIVHGETIHTSQDVAYPTHTQMTLVRDHLNKKIYYRFGTEVAIKTTALSLSSSGNKPLVIDSAANPKIEKMGTQNELSPYANFSYQEKSDSIALKIKFPPRLKEGMVENEKQFVFAKSSTGEISSWTPKKGWRKCPDGKLIPLEELQSQRTSVKILMSDKFLKKNPGMEIFAGDGLSEAEMFLSESFTKLFEVPKAEELDMLPAMKAEMRSRTKTSKAQ